ncbi:hypothetical protein KX928_23660 [Roseobacter sp. YSTF-M11]|uniref:Sulfotransferase domain-containing protein n=1 Tax=Roseobacter insulae TaxID=2859783 RepID=A0A9X1FZX9_9RHOB|nr:hypothetical protein [Roseobacter insulae]MBW4710799.1 hypothetical protein [Roseobacter insulae]
MAFKTSDLTNFIGARLLPFNNPRVVSPPGVLRPRGRPNIIVATPMRSGTHVLIDMILNNMPAYRGRPLYVDLDQCWKQGRNGSDLLGKVTPDAGYVVKTHVPFGLNEAVAQDPRVLRVLEAGIVVTVRRPRADVCRSMARWNEEEPGKPLTRYEAWYDQFWDFWQGYEQTEIAFEDLFQADRMQAILARLGTATGTAPARTFIGPPAGSGKRRIYANKALTRLIGHAAPRIDTTIHTLKG